MWCCLLSPMLVFEIREEDGLWTVSWNTNVAWVVPTNCVYNLSVNSQPFFDGASWSGYECVCYTAPEVSAKGQRSGWDRGLIHLVVMSSKITRVFIILVCSPDSRSWLERHNSKSRLKIRLTYNPDSNSNESKRATTPRVKRKDLRGVYRW